MTASSSASSIGARSLISPTAPIALAGSADRFDGPFAEIPDELLVQLGSICEVVTERVHVAEASRDWWPLALHWALAGEIPRIAGAVVRPTDTLQVSAVLAACNQARIPVTAAGGRSGVCGASVPVYGGILLDMTAYCGLGEIDVVSGVVEVAAGTFGPDMEHELQSAHQLTVGHFPQSFDLATVGGWVACRGAGQYSTRYGKIEEMVVGLEVVLADGTVLRTGGAPAAAEGPDLMQVFIGSEGTLGVITRVWLRAHPLPTFERRAAYRFSSFAEGIEACRLTIRRGATPAVLRLYDPTESARGRGGTGTDAVLLVLDQGDPALVEATMSIVSEACSTGVAAEVDLVEQWLQHRNDTSALQALTHRGFVVDTMEIAGPWSILPELYEQTCTALLSVPHARAASCHLSHSYLDGACLYFSFAATPPPDEVESTYIALWDAGQGAVLAGGGNLSHHHGVGLNRSRFMARALGPALEVLAGFKQSLDPHGILNPGKLGLESPFGPPAWP